MLEACRFDFSAPKEQHGFTEMTTMPSNASRRDGLLFQYLSTLGFFESGVECAVARGEVHPFDKGGGFSSTRFTLHTAVLPFDA